MKGEDLLSTATEKVLQALRLPEAGRVATKAAYRSDFAQQWAQFCETEPGAAWKTLSGKETVSALKASLDRLKNKRSKL